MPLLWLSLLFIAGVVLATWLGGPLWLWLVAALFCLILSILIHKGYFFFQKLQIKNKYIPVHPFLMLFAVLLGGFRYLQTRPVINTDVLAYYNDVGRIEFSGTIHRPADPLDSAILLDVEVHEVLSINDVDIRIPVKGRCLVRVMPGTDFHYGDKVVFAGNMTTPPEGEDFSYRDYLARKGIYSYMLYGSLYDLQPASKISVFSVLFGFRERAYETINAMMNQPEAGLLSGILIGMERDIPQYVEDDFQETGTSHIVAISGFNIALVAGLLTVLLDKILGKKLAPFAVVGGIFLYTILVGAQAAVVRAAIMGSISLMGRQIGRRGTGYNTLVLTAALMTWQNPLILGDVGFQLSFAATLGLVLFAGPWQDGLTRWITRRFSEEAAAKLSAPISEYFLFTFAAQLTTLPVILYHFGRISLSAFVANPLILPAQPLIMILGGPVVILGMLWLPLAKVLSWLVWPLLYYTIHMVGWVADITDANIPVQVGLGIGAVLLLFLIMLVFLVRENHPKLAMAMRPVLFVLVLVLANSFLWRELFRQPDGNLHLTVYPEGDCTVVLVESPRGQRVMVNGGSESSRLSAELGNLLPMTDREVNVLLIPQNKTACISAIPKLMERIKFSQLITAPVMEYSRSLMEMDEAAAEQGLDSVQFLDTLEIELEDGVQITLIPSQSGTSVTQLITWGNFSALLLWDGYMPCQLLEENITSFTLYMDGRTEPQILAEECPDLSVMIQAMELPLGSNEDGFVNLTRYRKFILETDGEQVWLSGVGP
jgi:competence protein ComEC